MLNLRPRKQRWRTVVPFASFYLTRFALSCWVLVQRGTVRLAEGEVAVALVSVLPICDTRIVCGYA